jgi:nucleoside-diphosphate-sugar epimerase
MKKILLTGAFGGLGSAIQEVGQGGYEFVCADNCFQAALKHKIGRVVLSSSIEVTIGASWATGGMGVIDEDSPPRFDHFYNLNKLQAETTALYYYQTAGITSANLRYMEFSRRDKMEIGYGLLARSLWNHDVARANLCAVESERVQCEPINVGPKTPLTNDDIVASRKDYDAVIEKHFPGATELIEKAESRHRKAELWPVATIDRARALLGWEPEWTFATFLDALREEQNNQ